MANIKTIPNEATVKTFNRIKNIILASVIALFVIICLFRCFYSVDEQHNAIVTQFGSIVKVDTAGFYFKAPWQSVRKVDMTTHGTGIGYTVTANGQNITDTDNGIMITSDFNLLNIDFYLEYRVSDPIAYVYASRSPEMTLSNITMANIRTVVSNYTVDEAMTTAKGQIQADVKAAILSELERTDIGLTVVNITIQDSEPPTPEIIAAFKSVENAKQGADTAMNKALAEAKKTSRIAEATGQVERFNKIYEEYKQFPFVTKRRLFYERLESVLPNCKVIITDGSTSTVYPLDSFTKADPAASAPANTDNNGGN